MRRVLHDQLPMPLAEDPFLSRYLANIEVTAESILDHVESVENLVDVDVTPDRLVPWLAMWLDSDGADEQLPMDERRRLVRGLGPNLPWRGTRRGVETLLHLVTGREVEVEDAGGIFREDASPDDPKRVVVHFPTVEDIDVGHLLDLVEDALPADVRFEVYAGRRRLDR